MVKSDYDSFFLFFCQNNHEGFYAWCAVWEQKVVGDSTQIWAISDSIPQVHALCPIVYVHASQKGTPSLALFA